MASKVSKPVNGVVTVKPGNTISQIAKANNLTTKEVLDLNPALKSNPKYNKGNTIFSNTKIRVEPKTKEVIKTTEETKTEEIIEATPASPSYVTYSAPSQDPVFNTPTPPPIKTSTPDIILFNEDILPDEIMADLIFENIGGQELISISRSDIVNGQKIIYQPIKNLSSIQQEYNPNNILGLQQTSDKYFAGFSIKLEDKIPEVGNGLNGQNAYIESNGDLVIEFININPDEQIEVKITLSGTIYE
jgi:LysM repeat protein